MRATLLFWALLMAGYGSSHAQTTLLKDISPGISSAFPEQFVQMGDTIVFKAKDRLGVYDNIWKSDGTPDGTQPVVKSSCLKVLNFSSNRLFVHRDLIYFVGVNSCAKKPVGTEWHVGTINGEGIRVLKDINPGPLDAVDYKERLVVPSPVALGDTVFFAARDSKHGMELWKTDGTKRGTVLVKDINPGPLDSIELPRFTAIGSTVFFFAKDNQTTSIALWKTDGTEGGTVLVSNINKKPRSTALPSASDTDGILAASSDKLFFRGFDGEELGLYATDGSPEGTIKLISHPKLQTNNLDSLFVWQERLFFRMSTKETGAELWTSDGTPDGTHLLKDIRPGPGSGLNASNFVPIQNELFFSASADNLGRELWKTDGTSDGTVMVANINPMGSSSPSQLTNVNGILYFSATHKDTGRELYRSDGTDQGTFLVSDLEPGPASSDPVALTALGSDVFFRAQQAQSGRELFFSTDSWILDEDPRLVAAHQDKTPMRVTGQITIGTRAVMMMED